MMAAARILIWLRVRLVRRSSISNMAFPLGACSFLGRASRLRTANAGKATLPARRTEAAGTRGTCAKNSAGRRLGHRATADCTRWSVHVQRHENAASRAGGLRAGAATEPNYLRFGVSVRSMESQSLIEDQSLVEE